MVYAFEKGVEKHPLKSGMRDCSHMVEVPSMGTERECRHYGPNMSQNTGEQQADGLMVLVPKG